MAKARKPKMLEVGKAYRLYRPFSQEPSEQIAVITCIRQMTKTSRQVEVEWLHPGPVWNMDNYTHFLARVHSEAPVTLN